MSIRIAGAQIPVGTNIESNKKEILKSLAWAKENNVDQLVTPECALSGYLNHWQDNLEEIKSSLTEIEEFVKECGVGLHLGCNFKEPEILGDVNRNEIRHYGKDGNLLGLTYKTYIIPMTECVVARNPDYDFLTVVPIGEKETAAGLICNDLWGYQECNNYPISESYKQMGLSLIIHCTNGAKYYEDCVANDVFQCWHEGYLRMTSYATRTPIITVDSCTPWEWDGNEDEVDKCMTSSTSGVLHNGEWKVSVPQRGRQYFIYDLESIDAVG